MAFLPRFRLALLALAGMLVPAGPALGQTNELRWNQPNFKDSYFGVDTGGYLVADNTDDVNFAGQDVPTTVTGNLGYGFGVRFGATAYDLLRAEFALAYMNMPVDALRLQTGGGGSSTNADGSLETFTFMGWTYYDALPDQRFSPIVGVGAGLAQARADVSGNQTIQQGGNNQTFAFDLAENGIAFAWGFAAGASYRVTERLRLELLYRNRSSWERDFAADVSGNSADYGVAVHAHTLSLGLRYPFGAQQR